MSADIQLRFGGPEWLFALFAFLFHFVWEMLQTPFFAGMAQMAHWPATVLCLQATGGDVVISLAGFWIAALVQRSRAWFMRPDGAASAAYLGVGLLATVVLEWVATAHGRWSYAPTMPVVPLLGVGLIPLAQWVILPIGVISLLQRFYRPR